MAQVWLVTGSSRGLGRAIVEAGLAAGDLLP
jgi:NAD(P)-dependent dehydrogenase (short-subunit alcohol dehydrogenase family)